MVFNYTINCFRSDINMAGQKFHIKGAYAVRNFEKRIFSIILYFKAEHLVNFLLKFQDDWSKIQRARAF